MVLIIKDLSLKRGSLVIIKDATFTLNSGESLLLTGPNGVGKTTLIRAIAGFIKPQSGSIKLTTNTEPKQPDLHTTEQQDNLSEQIHYIGHKNSIRASLTVLENLEFWQSFFGPNNPDDPNSDKPETTLKKVINDFRLKSLIHIPAGYLSAGQKRRLGLSRLALIKRPIWLLDEPTVSLDKVSSELIANAANDHLSEGGILIAATHIPLGIPFSQHIELKKNLEQDWETLI